MPEKIDIVHILLIVGYIIGLGVYLNHLWDKRKFREKSKNWGHREGEKHKSREGRRCPQCNNVIDRRRTVCQHCGQTFEINPKLGPHPDEVAKGIRKTEETEEEDRAAG